MRCPQRIYAASAEDSGRYSRRHSGVSPGRVNSGAASSDCSGSEGFALPNSHAPRSPGGGALPASATPSVRPIGRAVKLDALPPPPLCRPRTGFSPLLRTRDALRCLASPLRPVAPGRFPPNFDWRRLRPPALLRPAAPRLPPGRAGRPPRPLDRVALGIVLSFPMIRRAAGSRVSKRDRPSKTSVARASSTAKTREISKGHVT